MIELKNVSKFYSDNKIVTIGLKNINLKLNKGEFVAITGDSGSGKSTLLNVISSIDTYDEGEILYYGNETFYFNQNDSDIFRKNNVSFIFQKYNIVDSYNVLQNVMLPLLIQGKDEETAKKEALEIIKRVGLEHRIDNKGSKLSGGEKQRCVIARALATDAPILACDEPTGNLDKKTSEEIIKLIKEVSNDKLVLIVTHDYESIKDICTRKIKLSDGEIVEDITFKEGLEEKKKDLVLKDSKPSLRTLLKLSALNIISTPKKTIFSSFVFIFVSCLFLLLSLFMIQVSYEENYTYSEEYAMISDDRMIIYDDNHASLDMNNLSPVLKDYEYYENAFYEEINSHYLIGKDFHFNACLTYHKMDYTLVAGNNELNENEYILVMPEYSYYYGVESSLINQEIKIMMNLDYDYMNSIGTLVGFGFSNQINKNYLIENNTNKNLINIIINNEVDLNFVSSQSKRNIISKTYVANEEKTQFLIPSSFKNDIEFKFNLNNIYDVTYDIDVTYTDEVNKPILVVNKDYFNGEFAPNFNGVKEITVYNEKTKKLTRDINNLGLDVALPSMEESNNGISLIVLYLSSTLIIGALIIMFYISFAIIQRIYLTKTKDFSIFRTLGLVSKDLKKVLNLEVIIVTLISLLVGAILTNLLIIIFNLKLYKYVSILLLIFYTFIMIIFGLLTSNRLNSKIFKHSVYQSIREGSE